MKVLIRSGPSLLMAVAWYVYLGLFDSNGIPTLGMAGYVAITLVAWMATFVLVSKYRSAFVFNLISKVAFLSLFLMFAILAVVGINSAVNLYGPGYVLLGMGKLLLIEEPLRALVKGLAIAVILSFPLVVVYGKKADLMAAILCSFPLLSIAYKSSMEFHTIGMFSSVYVFVLCPLSTVAPIIGACWILSKRYESDRLLWREAAN